MLKKLVFAAAALTIAAPALAHDRGHGHRSHFNHGHFHRFHARPVVVVPAPRVHYFPAPVYYAPPPVVYRPVPVYAAPVYSAPVYSAPVYSAPVPPSSVSIRLHFPL